MGSRPISRGGSLERAGPRRNSETSRNLERGKEGRSARRGMRNARKEEFRALEGVIESHGGGPLAATRGP